MLVVLVLVQAAFFTVREVTDKVAVTLTLLPLAGLLQYAGAETLMQTIQQAHGKLGLFQGLAVDIETLILAMAGILTVVAQLAVMEGFQLSQLAIGVKTLLYTGLQAVFVVLLYDQFAFTVEVLLGAISFAVTEMLIAQQYPFVVERLTLALALTRAVSTFERQFAAWVIFQAFASRSPALKLISLSLLPSSKKLCQTP